MKEPLLQRDTTISYYDLPQNDDILTKIYDLHVKSLTYMLQVYSIFLVAFFVLTMGCTLWMLFTVSSDMEKAVGVVGAIVSCLGVLSGALGLKAVNKQSRGSSKRFYWVLCWFCLIAVIYIGVCLVLFSSNEWPDFTVFDLALAGSAFCVMGLLFALVFLKARQLNIILTKAIDSRSGGQPK